MWENFPVLYRNHKTKAKNIIITGTMGKEVKDVVDKDQATLYMLDQYNYLNPVDKVRPVSISNGIAWTSDKKFMFYIDTPTRNIDVFDFDLDNGFIRKLAAGSEKVNDLNQCYGMPQ